MCCEDEKKPPRDWWLGIVVGDKTTHFASEQTAREFMALPEMQVPLRMREVWRELKNRMENK